MDTITLFIYRYCHNYHFANSFVQPLDDYVHTYFASSDEFDNDFYARSAAFDKFDEDLHTKIAAMSPTDFFLQVLTRSLELTHYDITGTSIFIESLIFGYYFNTEDLPKLSTLEIGILESLFGLASFHHKMAKNDANFHYYNLKQDMEKLRNHYKNAG